MKSPTAPPAESAAAESPFEIDEMTLFAADQRLRIAWADGHSSDYAYAYLRGFCPCAVCQGHGNALAYKPYDESAGALAILDILEVGHYAANVVWHDLHRTGIYAWSYLRGLCACEQCVEQVGASHALHRLPKDAYSACGIAPERARQGD